MTTNTRKILIIDDTPEDRVTCRRYLAKDPDWRYEFLETEKASAGLALARAAQPDCILLDYALPDADGLAVLTQLTGQTEASALPVVMLTGTGEALLAVEALKRGAQDYLVKGRFTPEDLRLAVANAIEKAALINEQQRTVAALRASQERLKTVTNNATLALFIMDERQQCSYLNPAAEQLTGFTWEEVQGRTLHDVVHHTRPDGSPYPLAECPIDRAFPQNNQEQGREVFVHKDGSFYPVAFTASPLREKGRPVGTIIEVRNIAEDLRREAEREALLAAEREAREQAEITNRLKDEFLTTISHELRTPLNHILGWVVMLRSGKVAPEKLAEALATIERNVRTQSRLVEDLLDVSQLVTGKMQVRLQPVALAAVVEAAVASARSAAEAKGVGLQLELDAQPAAIMGDPDRLQQVVWNLLSNAIKFTPKEGRVRVQLARLKAQAEITVSDTGAGIAPAFLPHVFDRFSQADGSIRRKQGGLGLGLAIVRHLVEAHGGEVSAASRGLGQGATFKVKLPLAVARPSAPPTKHQASANPHKPEVENMPHLAGVRVLAVDDEAGAAQLFKAIFAGSGAEVRAASSMAEALDILADWRPAVLIADIELPNGAGYDLLHAIRRRDETRGQWLPAIALTAYACTEDRLRALTAGFQMYVAKPIEPQELLLVVARLIGQQ